MVNTTPIGMVPKSDETPVPKEILEGYRAIADIIYNPLETRLLREATAAGCSVASGLEMFVLQGVEQFRIWTGKEPPVAEMRKAVLDRLRAP